MAVSANSFSSWRSICYLGSQWLIVRKPTFVRAVNSVSTNEEHYMLVCDAARDLIAVAD